jgi:DUF3037 family protein
VPVSRSPFQYAIIKVVPRVERGECFNAGVLVLCRPKRFLGSRTSLDVARLAALAPGTEPSIVRDHLTAIDRIVAGDPSAGPIATLSRAERFGWLVAPSSTIIQPSAVHTGLCEDPAAELEHLFSTLVG